MHAHTHTHTLHSNAFWGLFTESKHDHHHNDYLQKLHFFLLYSALYLYKLFFTDKLIKKLHWASMFYILITILLGSGAGVPLPLRLTPAQGVQGNKNMVYGIRWSGNS
jgi:hypothetical protein